MHPSLPHMRQKRSHGSVQSTQLSPNTCNSNSRGGCCQLCVAICCIRSGGSTGGAVMHASCRYPGGGFFVGGCGAGGGDGSLTCGGLGGAKAGGLNPRPLRETRAIDSPGTELPGPASSPGRRRLSRWRRSRRPALPTSSAGRPVYAGFSSSLFISICNI